MTSGNRLRTALVAAVVTVGLAACADGDAESPAPGSVAGEGPARPAAGGGELVVEEQPLETPVVLDPVPDELLLTDLLHSPPDSSYEPYRATLYGDPDLADTLDGPVLLVGTSEGSASLAGPPYDTPGGREVDLGGRTGRVVADTDRTWVVIDGNDYREFVVGRGIDEDELVAAARGADFGSATATIDEDAVPAGLEPLVAGSPPDRPGGGSGEYLRLQGGSSSVSVSAVRAEPRLAALWGFWAEDAVGTEVRGHPGSAGDLPWANIGPDARGRIWAEDGLVIVVVVNQYANEEGRPVPDRDELLDLVTDNLRVGSWAEFEALDAALRNRPPTREESSCPRDGGFVSGVEGATRWAFQLSPNPVEGFDEWITCSGDFADGGGGAGSGSTIIPPPVGELAVSGGGAGVLGGVAPPGTARVTVAADGRVLEAQLSGEGPRPGERIWATFIPEQVPPSFDAVPFTVTAYDAAGAVLTTKAG